MPGAKPLAVWEVALEHGAKAPGVSAAGWTRHSNVTPGSLADEAQVTVVSVVEAPSPTPAVIVVSGAVASILKSRTASRMLPALSVARTVRR